MDHSELVPVVVDHTAVYYSSQGNEIVGQVQVHIVDDIRTVDIDDTVAMDDFRMLDRNMVIVVVHQDQEEMEIRMDVVVVRDDLPCLEK